MVDSEREDDDHLFIESDFLLLKDFFPPSSWLNVGKCEF